MRVVVIAVRGLHLGFLGCYGNDWIDTPTVDRLAAEGVVFDQHYADAPDPDAARTSWRTGRYHLPLADDADTPPAEGATDLVALLRDAGVATYLVRDDSRPAPEGFAAGWEHVVRVAPAGGEGDVLGRVVAAAGGALDRLAGRDRWLLWLDLATPLPPWDVPEPFRSAYFREEEPEDEDADDEEQDAAEPGEPLAPLTDPAIGPTDPQDDATFLRLRNSYAAAVSYLDAGLDRLREELDSRGLLEQVLLVLTADHGVALGEHGIVGPYRPWLHDELIHVPLLLRLPGRAQAGRHVPALTQSVDLLPTLLDAFALPPPDVHGHSLLPLARGEKDRVRDYACSGLRVGGAVEWALRTPAWGFLLPVRVPPEDPPRTPQLYVKPDDRWEVNNVVQHHLELAEHLEQVVRGFAEADRRQGPLQPPPLRDVEAESAEAEPDNAQGTTGGSEP
jgi:arylsulfatase A-like enzyme